MRDRKTEPRRFERAGRPRIIPYIAIHVVLLIADIGADDERGLALRARLPFGGLILYPNIRRKMNAQDSMSVRGRTESGSGGGGIKFVSHIVNGVLLHRTPLHCISFP